MHSSIQVVIAVLLLVFVFIAYHLGKTNGKTAESMVVEKKEKNCTKCGQSFAISDKCDKCKVNPKHYNLLTANADRRPWEPADSKQTGFEVANYEAGLDSIMYKDWTQNAKEF